MQETRHFLDLHHFDPALLRQMLSLSARLKDGSADAGEQNALTGKTLAMIFERPSTRTRVSFEVGMKQLGGDVVILSPNDMQLGRGETIADTAQVLSRYVDGILIRARTERTIVELARHASVPVINGLTDKSHPCQVMADILTFEERLGSIEGRQVTWVGDGNNVAASWIHAAVLLGFELRLACPDPLLPAEDLLKWAREKGGRVHIVTDPREAVKGSQCIVTDTWVSMHDSEDEDRHGVLRTYQVNHDLMELAAPDAIFMHCLPAHRGEEVTDDVIDGPKSAVFDEAENRLHAQKAILSWCLGNRDW